MKVSVVDQFFLFLIGSRRYDVLPVTSVEGLVFIAPDNDADHHWWAAVDSDCCPWPEVYSYGDFDDALSLPAIPPPTGDRRKKRQRHDASDSDSMLLALPTVTPMGLRATMTPPRVTSPSPITTATQWTTQPQWGLL